MKKLIGKIFKKEKPNPLTRITTDTVSEHKEQVLSNARRFKYPLQYSRHKLVINAIVISIIFLILIILFGWWRLYVVKDTSDFMYRVTSVVPVPVASVDGRHVSYGDYLLSYRSSVHYAKQKENLSEKTDEGKKKIDNYKEQSMQAVIANTYAAKVAKDLSLELSGRELDKFMKQQRQSSDGEISQQTFDASILDFLGLSPSEYRRLISSVLLRYKVSYELDKPALEATNGAIDLIKNGAGEDFAVLAETVSKKFGVSATHGLSGLVTKTNQDGGLAVEAAKLTKGQTSAEPIQSSKGGGYYVLRLVDINDTQVNYEYITVPLTIFESELNKIFNKNKVDKYI